MQELYKCNTAFGEQERADIRLATAARNNPYLNSAAANSLRAYASQMQTATNISDDLMESQMAVLAGYQLTENQIRDVIAAAADWSATGMISFEAAVQQLGRSYSGMAGMMGRMLPGVRDLTEEELKHGAAVDKVREAYGGMADQMRRGLLGSRESLKTAGDELMEAIGRWSAPVEKVFNNAFARMADEMAKELNRGFDETDPDAWLRNFAYDFQNTMFDITGFFEAAFNDVFHALNVGWTWLINRFIDGINFVMRGMAAIEIAATGLTREVSKTERRIIESKWTIGPVSAEPAPLTRRNQEEARTVIDQMRKWFEAGLGIEKIREYAEAASRNSPYADVIMAQFRKLEQFPKAVQDGAQAGSASGAASGTAAGIAEAEERANRLMKGGIKTDKGPHYGGGDMSWLEQFGQAMIEQAEAIRQGFMEKLMPGNVAASIFNMLSGIENVAELLDPIGTVLKAMLTVLEPVVNALLAPLVGFLQIIGHTLGAILVPILQIFAPVLEVVAAGMVLLYNLAIVPLGNGIIFIMKVINDVVATVWNGIAAAINALLGWLGVHLKYMSMSDYNSGYLEPISQTDLATNTTGTATGSSASYSQSRNITVNVWISTEVIAGDMGIRDLALKIRDEIKQAEMLGA